jgi:hypothetical protein
VNLFKLMKNYLERFAMFNSVGLFQHLFASSHSTELRQKMIDMAVKFIGIGIKVLKDPITLDEFSAQRLGKFRFVKFYVHVLDADVYTLLSICILLN